MPRKGPAPTPSNIKLLRGNPGKRRIDIEDEPDFGAMIPDPPPELDGDALAEWQRVTPMLFAQKVLTGPDMAMLAIYCLAFSRWRAAERAIAKAAKSDPDGMGLVDVEYQTVSPWLRVSKEAAAEMHKAAVEFGMTPSARTRVKISAQKKTNPFANNGPQKKA